MAYLSLTRRDVNVLHKIKDPESDPCSGPVLDASLPRDAHLSDEAVYQAVAQREKEIITCMQSLDLQLSGSRPRLILDIAEDYRRSIAHLDRLIAEFPHYASARNNRAQAIRRLLGDSMLVEAAAPSSHVLLSSVEDSERLSMARTVLADLSLSISLLTPAHQRPRLSPQAARTLSMAYTQRAAIYLATASLMVSASLSVHPDMREISWTKLDFQEKASHDFAMGGRYGNDIAKGLAVGTNPTARLCGQMVREAMRKEYSVDTWS